MASIGTISLEVEKGTFSPGAAFVLREASNIDANIQLEDGEVSVGMGCHYVVASLNNANGPEEAFQFGHQVAQRGLDMMAITGKVSLSTTRSSEEYLLWWGEQGRIVFRSVSTCTLKIRTSSPKISVRDVDGNEVKQPVIEPRYSPAFRYFRLAQITDDLFDAFRNAYLCFEMLLSSICPKGNSEREIEWLRRSLSLALEPSDFQIRLRLNTSDPVSELLTRVYSDTRLPLFHAKDGRNVLEPHDPGTRNEVADALELLLRTVLTISEKHFQARFPRGGMFKSAFNELIAPTLSNLRMLISSDNSPLDPKEGNLDHTRFKEGIQMDAEFVSPTSPAELPIVRGVLDCRRFDSLTTIRRIDLFKPEKPLVAVTLDDDIGLQGIDEFQNYLRFSMQNMQQPRTSFSM